MTTVTDDLRLLRRHIARIAHPDLAKTDLERVRFTLLMAQANAAFSDGDVVRLQQLLALLTPSENSSPRPSDSEDTSKTAGASSQSKAKPSSSQKHDDNKHAHVSPAMAAQRTADRILQELRAGLPAERSADEFRLAVRLFVEDALNGGEYAKLEDLAPRVPDLLGLWDRVRGGLGDKMAKAHAKINGELAGCDLDHPVFPYRQFRRDAYNAYMAFSLPLLQETLKKLRAARKEELKGLVQAEATVELFAMLSQIDAEESKLKDLLSQSPFLGVKDRTGDMVLHAAVRRCSHPAIIELLVNAGADVNAINRDGETPLQIALINMDIPTARMLLNLGADGSVLTSQGQSTDRLVQEIIKAISEFFYSYRQQVAPGEPIEMSELFRFYSDEESHQNPLPPNSRSSGGDQVSGAEDEATWPLSAS